MEASPKVRGSRAPSPSDCAAGIGEVLMLPAAAVPKAVAGPHSLPVQVRRLIVGLTPPLLRS
jgi:hypothetical protein